MGSVRARPDSNIVSLFEEPGFRDVCSLGCMPDMGDLFVTGRRLGFRLRMLTD